MLKVLLLVLTFASVSTASFASSFLLSCLGDYEGLECQSIDPLVTSFLS